MITQVSFLLFIILIVFLCVSFALNLMLHWKLQDSQNYLIRMQGKGSFFTRRKYFLSGNEKALLRKLKEVVPMESYEIFPQIHLSSLVKIDDSAVDLAGKFEWVNRFYVDFVIFDKANLLPQLVIELNDRTHNLAKTKSRDEFVAYVLKTVGLNLLTLTTEDIPKQEWRNNLTEMLSMKLGNNSTSSHLEYNLGHESKLA